MRIVNLKHKPAAPYIYCGRFMPHSPVGKLNGSPLRNPFWVGKYGADAIPLFRKHLFELVQNEEPSVMALMLEIDEQTTLACWCVDLEGNAIFEEPEQCHCQVIWKCWNWLKTTGKL
jgi:hypothetical protein